MEWRIIRDFPIPKDYDNECDSNLCWSPATQKLIIAECFDVSTYNDEGFREATVLHGSFCADCAESKRKEMSQDS